VTRGCIWTNRSRKNYRKGHVVHELFHLFDLDHTEAFWNEADKVTLSNSEVVQIAAGFDECYLNYKLAL